MGNKRTKRRKISRWAESSKEVRKQKVQRKKELTKTYRKSSNNKKSNTNFSSIFVWAIFGFCAIVAVGFILGGIPTNIAGQGSQSIPQDQYQIPYSVTTIHGETIPLSSLQGKSVFYYFTGASCVPCMMQLPYIISAYDTYKSSGKIEVISLDIQGHSINDLLAWEQSNGITWKVCQDSGLTLASFFSVSVMPTLISTDENGNELNRYIGAHDEATIFAIFESVVN